VAGEAGEQIPVLVPGALAGVQTVPDLARLLRQLRRREARRRGDSELTYRELAAKTGWSRGIIGEYLAGKVLPPTDRFDILVTLLGATPAEQGALATARDRVEEGRRATAPIAATPQVPQELPADVFGFIGRVAPLAELDGLLREGRQTSAVAIGVVSGTAGVGKTALAVHWAHRVAEQFPDGQLYIDLRGYDPDQPLAPAAALGAFLRSLGVDGGDVPGDLAERSARYRSLLAGRRMFILLDNARAADQVRPLLPGTPSCLVLVTSRDDLAGLVARDGARRIDLDVLSPGDAVDLLHTLVGSRVDAEPAASTALAQSCARLPLALRVAAELAVVRGATTIADLVDDLRDQHRRLDVLDARSDPRAAVRGVFSWSHQHLSPEAARLFALAGLHPGQEFDDYAVAALTGAHLGRARRIVDELARAHLVQPTHPGRYAMHDLLRAYAREKAAESLSEDDARAAQTRLFDHYRYAAGAAMDTLFPIEADSRPLLPVPPTPTPLLDEPELARAWLNAELANLVAVSGHCADHGWPEHPVDLSKTLFRFLDAHGRYQEALDIHSNAVRVSGTDPPGRAAALNHLGLVYLQLGRPLDALDHLQRLLVTHRDGGDRLAEARVLGTLGQVYERLGRYPESVDHMRQSLAIHREVGQRRRAAMQLGNLGVLFERMGRYREAAEHDDAAAAIFREEGDERFECYVYANVAVRLEREGRYEEALELLDRVLAVGRRHGVSELEAHALTTLGTVYRGLGRHAEALDQLELALDLGRTIGERGQEAYTLNSLGETARLLAEPVTALTHHEAAEAVARQIGYRREYARALAGQGHAHDALGDGDRARGLWREALEIYTDLGVPEALDDDARAQVA